MKKLIYCGNIAVPTRFALSPANSGGTGADGVVTACRPIPTPLQHRG
jgi:hypothetical protein